MEKPLLRVAVSGAAGQIAQHLLFMASTQTLTLSLYGPVWRNRFLMRDTAVDRSDRLFCTLQLASGGCFGMDQPLAFQLLESKDQSLDSLEGIAMELEDSLYPLLREVRWRQALHPLLGKACWTFHMKSMLD